jgi:pimeloyl-ACP methyl ester carboxylesterase
MPSELYCTVPSEASLFKTKDAEASYRSAYEASLRLWPAGCEPIEIPTKFGLTHVLACGTPSGEPVLLLPAMAFSATMWYATVSGLSSEFRCYAVDFPSDMGLSAPTRPPADRSDCVAFLHELLEGLGIVSASFVGASYGSFLALNYAIAAPGCVKKLALSSPAGSIVPLRKLFYARLFLSMLVPGGSAVERLMNWLFADRVPLDNPVIQQLIVGTKALRSGIKAYPRVFADSELAGIFAPVQLLFGDKEVCYNPWSAAKRARQVMPRAFVEMVPDAGHLLVMEHPEFVNQRLLEFLRKP